VPLASARPRIVLNLVLAVIFGLGLGVASAIVAESVDSRVRSVAGLIEATDMVVLAEIPRFAVPLPRSV
jgi:capsular polysaccharide biosynthesis protein